MDLFALGRGEFGKGGFDCVVCDVGKFDGMGDAGFGNAQDVVGGEVGRRAFEERRGGGEFVGG